MTTLYGHIQQQKFWNFIGKYNLFMILLAHVFEKDGIQDKKKQSLLEKPFKKTK
jgi:hypothetical protein